MSTTPLSDRINQAILAATEGNAVPVARNDTTAATHIRIVAALAGSDFTEVLTEDTSSLADTMRRIREVTETDEFATPLYVEGPTEPSIVGSLADDEDEFAAGLYPCNICKVPCEDPGAIHLAPESILDVEPSPMRDPFAAGALVPDRITTVSGSTYTFTEHALCVGEPHYVTVTCLSREQDGFYSPTAGMSWVVERDDIHLTRGALLVDGINLRTTAIETVNDYPVSTWSVWS